MEIRHIGSNERAALIRLYSQYEFKELHFINTEIESGHYVELLNQHGKLGWHHVSSEWSEDGAVFVLERQVFSIEHALERLKNG